MIENVLEGMKLTIMGQISQIQPVVQQGVAATVAQASMTGGWEEYGALGLTILLLISALGVLWKYMDTRIQKKDELIAQKDSLLVDIIQKSIASGERLASVIESMEKTMQASSAVNLRAIEELCSRIDGSEKLEKLLTEMSKAFLIAERENRK